MENLKITQTLSTFHIQGFPDAVKVLALKGKQAKRLSDLALHRADLEFARQCLDALTIAPEEPTVLKESLWRSAVIHTLKCFGDSGSRFQLQAKKVLKDQSPNAMVVFNYFKALRDKHFIHDENSHSQSIPGAILNRGDALYKIERIVCLELTAMTLVPDNLNNLNNLINKTMAVVMAEFEELCASFTEALEKMPYEALLAMDSPKYQAPLKHEIYEKRTTP